MWDLPGPGLEPESPALAGGFLTTAPPGKPKSLSFREEKTGRKPAKWTTVQFSKDSSACKMVLLKRGSPGYLRVGLKINKEIPGFSDTGGRGGSVRRRVANQRSMPQEGQRRPGRIP